MAEMIRASSDRRWIPGAAALLTAALLLTASARPAAAGEEEQPASDPVLSANIVEGSVYAGRLWLRGLSGRDDSGALVSWSLADGSRRVDFAGGVHDFVATPDGFWVLRIPTATAPGAAHVLVISRLRGSRFEDLARFRYGRDETPIALAVRGGELYALTSRRVWTFSKSGHLEHEHDLGMPLERAVVVSTATLGSAPGFYVGLAEGEFGGGLWRVDPATGKVAAIERRESDDRCAGPLNRECDPVTGVIPDPEREDCVLASVGLFHIGVAEGRVLRVCGEDVEVAYALPLPAGEADEFRRNDPIFSLAPAPDGGFWAGAGFALYRISGGAPARLPLPEVAAIGGLRAACVAPGAIVVLTDVHRIVSVSGAVDLVVPLEAGTACPGWLRPGTPKAPPTGD